MDLFNSKFILNEKRMRWIDYDKGISIILVGFGHCYGSLTGFGLHLSSYPFFNYFGAFFFGFRMPLFFIISGLLIGKSLNKKGLGNYIGDRANNILLPLLTWGILEVTLLIAMSRWFPGLTNTGRVGPKTYLFLITNPDVTGHFWYLNALFFVGTLYAFLKIKLKVPSLAQVVLGLALFSSYAYLYAHNISAGILNHVFEYYIFFAVGDFISKFLMDEEYRQKLASWKIFVLLLPVFLVLQYYCTGFLLKPNPDGMHYVEHKMPFLFLVEALVGCALSLNCSFLLQRYGRFAWLRVVGYHSLFIYVMQIIVMILSRVFLVNMLHITYVPALIMLVWTAGTVLPIFIYYFSLKFNLWFLYTFRKPKEFVVHVKKANIFRPKWALQQQLQHD